MLSGYIHTTILNKSNSVKVMTY